MWTDDDSGGGARETSRAFAAEMRRAAEELRAADAAARGLSRAIGLGLRGALDDAVFGAARLSDALRGAAVDSARGALRAAATGLGGAVAAGLAGAVGQAAGALAAGGGGAVSPGVRAFARGGVVDSPTFFASRGGLGVAGEAGPEAILPLARGADGRLGVRGGGGARVTVNVSTPNADSFRRSSGQIAAELARAVDRGRRRL